MSGLLLFVLLTLAGEYSSQVHPEVRVSDGVTQARCQQFVMESVPGPIATHYMAAERSGVPRRDIWSECVAFSRGDERLVAIVSLAGHAALTLAVEGPDGKLQRVAEAEFPSMGETPYIELRDLDGDGTPELLPSTSSPNGHYTRYAAARFDGRELQFIDARTTGEELDMMNLLFLNPRFADLDGDGVVEVRAEYETDDGEILDYVYFMREGRYTPESRSLIAYANSIGRVEGKPAVFREPFDLNDFEGPYEIVIYPERGKPFPASASIVVNDVEVVKENDFNPGVTSIRKPVVLRGLNDFKATVYGKPGSYANVLILEAKPE